MFKHTCQNNYLHVHPKIGGWGKPRKLSPSNVLSHTCSIYRRAPFFRGLATNFANGARKGVRGNYFHETTLAKLFTIHVNLHAMEFPLIFGEANFMEVPKIREIYGP